MEKLLGLPRCAQYNHRVLMQEKWVRRVRVRGDVTIQAKVRVREREVGRCYTAGFEDKEKDHETMYTGSFLKLEKARE